MTSPIRFLIKHITKESGENLIYGVSLNGIAYFFSKTLSLTDCKQIDSQPLLDPAVFTELCTIITEIELVYDQYSSLEMINRKIGLIQERIRVGGTS